VGDAEWEGGEEGEDGGSAEERAWEGGCGDTIAVAIAGTVGGRHDDGIDKVSELVKERWRMSPVRFALDQRAN
jgi:hypothetical protein